jgi:hypothetical protein
MIEVELSGICRNEAESKWNMVASQLVGFVGVQTQVFRSVPLSGAEIPA